MATRMIKQSIVRKMFNDKGKQVTSQAIDVLDVLIYKKVYDVVRRTLKEEGRITEECILMHFNFELEESESENTDDY